MEIVENHFGLSVALLGLRPFDFWLLTPREFWLIYSAYVRAKRKDDINLLSAVRLAGWMPASMLTSKRTKPSDFFKLPGEGSKRKKRLYTDEEKLNFLNKMKPEWKELMD